MAPMKPLAKELARFITKNRLTYQQFKDVSKAARQLTNLKGESKPRSLPNLPTEAELSTYYNHIEKNAPLRDIILLKLLFFTALRVKEITGILISNIDLDSHRIFIEHGKGDKDRVVLFPESFKLPLQSYLMMREQMTDGRQEYLFESNRKGRMSTRRVQQIVSEYAIDADITKRFHPHLFRHTMLTYLTSQNIPDAKIQLISGHASKESLAIYQHLALKDVSGEYQDAVRKMRI